MNAFNNVEASTEEIWNQLRTALLDTTNETSGKTKKRHHKRETWWWNDEVNSAIAEKRRCWKAWKQGGGKEQYLQAKRNAKRTVYTAKTAEEKKFSDLKPGMDDIFKIAKQESCLETTLNFLLRTRNCTSHLLTLKRRSIAYQEKSSGGPCENLA